MLTPTRTPDETKLFDARPKTVREIAQALAKVKGEFIQLSTGPWSTSHSAPLGITAKWPDGESLLGFIGQARFKREPEASGRPWEEIWWLHTGCGGYHESGFEYQFVIWMADVPEAAVEWNERISASMNAKNNHQALIQAVEKEVAEAGAEIWKRRRQEMVAAEEKNGKEWADFERWKDSQIVI